MQESWTNTEKNTYPEKKGPVQIFYEAYNQGEISHEDLNKLTSFNIADTLYDHPARPYPHPKENLELYVNSRAKEFEKRDEQKSKENGDWLFLIREIANQNIADIELLIWARDYCLKYGEKQRAFAINKNLDKHAENSFDKHYFRNATRVQDLDAREKNKKN